MMELVMHTEKNDTMFHTEKTGMLILMVEIDVGSMTADVADKVTCSFDDVQLEQVDRKYIHALNEFHLHDIRVVPNRHEVDQRAVKISSKSHVVILPSGKQTYQTHHTAYTPSLVLSMTFLTSAFEFFPIILLQLYECLPMHRPLVEVLGE
nr:hypothetical protein [Tanacetum cinerariifolium]